MDATLNSLASDLGTHELNSKTRFEELRDQLTAIETQPKGTDVMTDGTNMFAPAAGTGLGAGVVGGLLGGMLLNNGGLFGGNRMEPVATQALVTSRFDAEAQREIQATIERVSAANLLAIGTSTASLGTQMAKDQGETNTQIALTSGATQTQAALNAAAVGVQVQKTAGDLGVAIALQGAALGVAVEKASGDIRQAQAIGDAATQSIIGSGNTANALGFKDVAIGQLQVQYALATAIKADGDLTRGLIIAQNDATLNRLLTTAQNEIIELRGDRNHENRSHESELRISQTVNTSQAQSQQQQQQQQQFQLFSDLNCSLRALVQQNQTIHNGIVNLGTMVASGNPTNANTRVNS